MWLTNKPKPAETVANLACRLEVATKAGSFGLQARSCMFLAIGFVVIVNRMLEIEIEIEFEFDLVLFGLDLIRFELI